MRFYDVTSWSYVNLDDPDQQRYYQRCTGGARPLVARAHAPVCPSVATPLLMSSCMYMCMKKECFIWCWYPGPWVRDPVFIVSQKHSMSEHAQTSLSGM